MEQFIRRDVHVPRVTVVGFPVGERELGALYDGVDVIDGVVAHADEVEPGEQSELLEKYGSLAPQPCLAHRVAVVVHRRRSTGLRGVGPRYPSPASRSRTARWPRRRTRGRTRRGPPLSALRDPHFSTRPLRRCAGRYWPGRGWKTGCPVLGFLPRADIPAPKRSIRHGTASRPRLSYR